MFGISLGLGCRFKVRMRVRVKLLASVQFIYKVWFRVRARVSFFRVREMLRFQVSLELGLELWIRLRVRASDHVRVRLLARVLI